MLSFDEYVEKAMSTAIFPNAGTDLAYPTLGLVGEAGEIANKVKKVIRDDAGKLSQLRRNELVQELGDVLWYVAILAKTLDASLADIAAGNLAKLAERKERGTLRGSGDQR